VPSCIFPCSSSLFLPGGRNWIHWRRLTIPEGPGRQFLPGVVNSQASKGGRICQLKGVFLSDPLPSVRQMLKPAVYRWQIFM
jgi:hypothetical protein